MKKLNIAALAMGLLLFLTASTARAERLLTEEQALKDLLPGTDRVEKVTRTLSQDEVKRVSERLGGSLTITQKGSQSKEVTEVHVYNFFFGYKGAQKTGVLVFDSQPGKWGPVDFAVVLDPANAQVQNMAVMAFTEKRGRPIALKSFTSLFVGKTSKDPIEVNKDIRAISGATISCRSAAFQVKKIVALYEEVFVHRSVVDRLKDTEYYNVRTEALKELMSLSKSEQDEMLSYLITDLGRKDITECEKRAIISALNVYTKPELKANFESIKYQPGTIINTNFEETISKAAELAGVKLTWGSDALKSSASQIKIEDKLKPEDSDSFWVLLEYATARYGCSKHRTMKDDKYPAYVFSFISGDTVNIIDLETGVQQWLEWWKNRQAAPAKEKK